MIFQWNFLGFKQIHHFSFIKVVEYTNKITALVPKKCHFNYVLITRQFQELSGTFI